MFARTGVLIVLARIGFAMCAFHVILRYICMYLNRRYCFAVLTSVPGVKSLWVRTTVAVLYRMVEFAG